MKEPSLKACGYVRVSTAVQAAEGESLHTQQKQIQEYARYKKFELIDIVEDAGISGARESRPGFDKMMQQARAGAFQVLIVAKFSRLARNTRHLLNTVNQLEALGIRLHSIGENFTGGDSAQSRFLLQILAAVAELERETIKESMLVNRMARWQRHDIFPGRAPFAYRWNKEARRLEVDAAEAEVYKRIVSDYVDLGKPLKTIAVELQQAGVKNRRVEFSVQVLSYILKNPVYHGDYVVNKFARKDGRKVKTKAASEHIRFEVEALITRQRWDAIQQRLDSHRIRSRNAGPAAESFWLRDILVCGECSGRIKPRKGANRKCDGEPNRYYSCFWSRCGDDRLTLAKRERCHLPLLRADDLEAAVWTKVLMRLTFWKNKNQLRALLSPDRWEKQIASLEKRAGGLKGKLAKKTKSRSNLMTILERDLSEAEQAVFVERLAALEGEVHEIKAQLLQVEGEIASTDAAMKQSSSYVSFIEDQAGALNQLAEKIAALGPKEKKVLVNAMADGPVVVSGDRRDDKKAFVCRNYPTRLNLQALQEVLKLGGDADPKGGGGSKSGSNNPVCPWNMDHSTLSKIYQTG